MSESKVSRDDRLASIVQRIVRLHNERDDSSNAIKDVFLEARSAGYDVKALRVVIKRTMESGEERQQREEVDSIVEVMLAALGQLADSPLGQAAITKLRVAV